MRYLLVFHIFLIIFFPNNSYSDQGLNISCVNMKNLLDKEYVIHRYKFDVTTFKYFDHDKNLFVEVPNKNLIIKKDFFAARFPNYELGFQINEFDGGKDPIMSMSKYDYINDIFLEHYLCDVKVAEIN